MILRLDPRRPSLAIGWILLMLNVSQAFTSHPHQQRRFHHLSRLLATSASIVDHDFSSPFFWDEFYEQQLASLDTTSTGSVDNAIQNTPQDDSTAENNNIPAFVFEWHDSISLQDLAEVIPVESKCLMVGCGNSFLPQVVLDRKESIHLTLLDTSRACLDQLEAHYGTKEVSFVCGSATKMASYFVKNTEEPNHYYDCIVDKGLTDAFMCGEGWERPVEALLTESAKLLDPQRGGLYLLVSYKMGPAIQELFQEMCDAVNEDLVWEWEFDSPALSNHRVSVSLATVRPRNKALP